MKSFCVVHSLLVLTCVLAFGPTAGGCPFCDGDPPGLNPVGERIFGDDFWRNVCYTALPFAVLLAVTVPLWLARSPGQDRLARGAVRGRRWPGGGDEFGGGQGPAAGMG